MYSTLRRELFGGSQTVEFLRLLDTLACRPDSGSHTTTPYDAVFAVRPHVLGAEQSPPFFYRSIGTALKLALNLVESTSLISTLLPL